MRQESLRDIINIANMLGRSKNCQRIDSSRRPIQNRQQAKYTITAQSLDTVDVYVNGIYDTGGLVKVVDGCRITFLHHDLDALKNKLRPEIRELRRPKWVQSLRRLLRQLLGIRL